MRSRLVCPTKLMGRLRSDLTHGHYRQQPGQIGNSLARANVQPIFFYCAGGLREALALATVACWPAPFPWPSLSRSLALAAVIA